MSTLKRKGKDGEVLSWGYHYMSHGQHPGGGPATADTSRNGRQWLSSVPPGVAQLDHERVCPPLT